MSIFKLVILAIIAFGIYAYQDSNKKEKVSQFVSVTAPNGASPDSVIVVAPANCPKAAGRRADSLVSDLIAKGITYSRIDNVQFSGMSDKKKVAAVSDLMGGPLPIVFIGNRGMNNPSISEILTEIRKQRKRP